MTRTLTSTTKPAFRTWRRFALIATVATATLVPASAAQAEWYFTKNGAEKRAKDYVSKRYANTYVSDLEAECRPKGRRTNDPRYKFYAWVCYWADRSDSTYGKVSIKGAEGPGAYVGKVLWGARRA